MKTLVLVPIRHSGFHDPQICGLCGRITDSGLTTNGNWNGIPVCRPCDRDRDGFVVMEASPFKRAVSGLPESGEQSGGVGTPSDSQGSRGSR